MKLISCTLTLLSLFFYSQSAAFQVLPKNLEEQLDSLYSIAEYSQGEQIVRNILPSYLPTNSPADTNLAWLHLQLGIFSQELGKFANAEDEYLKAKQLYAASFSNDNSYVASVLSRLAVLYSEQGRFSDAKDAALQQFHVYSATYGVDHPYTALASVVLSLELINNDEPDSSKELLSKYGPIILNNFGASSKEAARLHEAEGRAAFAGSDYKNAETSFILARKTAANTPGDKHPLTARIALALARTRLILGNTDSALSNVNDALAVAFRASGPSHPFTAECLITKACIEEAMGSIPSAFEFYRKAIQIYKEATKENFRYTSERERLAFIQNVNQELARLASSAIRTSAFYPQGIGVFYDGLLFEKGVVLSSLQAMRRTAVQSGDVIIEHLLDSLAEIRTRRSELISGAAGIKKKFLDQDSLAEISNNLEKELARKSQAFKKLENLGNIFWEDIRNSTDNKNISVEISRFPYYDGERKTDTSFYAALIISKNDTSHPRLAIIGRSRIIEDSSVIRQYFRSLEKHAKKKNSTAVLIAKVLWSPLEPYLDSAVQIILSPDGIYDQLSLGALSGDDGKPLAEHYQISTVASTEDILSTSKIDSSHSVAIFADPDYSTASSTDVGALAPLPGTLKEAEAIEASFQNSNWNVKMFTGKDATEENLKAIRHPEILHIATHGKFSALTKSSSIEENTGGSNSFSLENSLIGSALYFNGANSTLSGGSVNPQNDGVLTALEASDLDLGGTDLVTLSACESGKGVIQPGEGAFGLARAIRTAGARNILMSLWQVPDKETKELMTSFYKNLLDNQSKSESLRNAELAERNIVIKRYGDDIPYFWAGFVLIGF